jgi:hypothetical protein
MKILRFAGVLVILLASLGTAKNVSAGTITCVKYCDDIFYSGTCTGTLAQCCNFNKHCPAPYTYMSGNCTDGVNNCP